MWRNGAVAFLFVILTGFSQSQLNDEMIILKQDENIVKEIWDGELENMINVEDLDLKSFHEEQLPMQDDQFSQDERKITPEQVFSERKTPSNKRSRRQAQSVTSLLDSASQGCDGIDLKWNPPNSPFSLIYHSENPEFKYYNIYRETSYFSSVSGLKPIASGEHFEELRHPNTLKWTDKFPPSGTSLFYAVTVVNYQGKETQSVEPKQVTFYGAFEKSFNPQAPVPIIPSLLKGNVLHHSLAYNPSRNEYMVAFDLDVNNDNSPDHVYAARVSPLGQIVDKQIVNATLGIASMQGHPSVAFNPTTQQYFIAFQLRIAAHFQGKSIIVGMFSLATKTEQHGPPSVLLKATKDGKSFLNSIQPKLIYNSGSGGFALSVLLDDQPKTALALFVTANGVVSSAQPMFKGEVFDVKPFMDTKNQHVYFIFQVAQWAATVTSGTVGGYHSQPYLIAAMKANATGSWLILTDPQSPRHLVGFTAEKNAAIDGYFNPKNGWLSVFWNNRVNGKRVISSANIFGMPGRFLKENTSTSCGIQRDIHGAATCYLPGNNGNILLWEEGNNKLGGYIVKDDTFQPVRGKQMRPRLVYNHRSRQVFVVWAEDVGGRVYLFVRNINPSSRISCTPSCSSTMKCAMYNACTPKTTVAPVSLMSCSRNNGGCSDTCVKGAKGRQCTCPASYSLSLDGMKCSKNGEKPDVSLLYSSEGSIWSVSIYDQSKRVTFVKIPIQGQVIIAFAYNEKDKYLYWADAKEERIYRAFLDGTNKQTLVGNQVQLPDGMVVDPDAKQLYWADGILGAIFRCALDGSNKIPFVSNLIQPRALALHKGNRWLYWTTWGPSATIERINTDGTGRQVLLYTGLTWPNGLTIAGTTLYWVDAFHDTIEMSDLNGQGRVAITKQGDLHPYGVGIHGNRLFWTDWSGNIIMLDKRTPSDTKAIVTGIQKPFSLQVYNDAAQPQGRFCTDPSVPVNGERNPLPDNDGKYKVGAKIILTCNPGFVHLGSNSRRCLRTKHWSGTRTQCIALPVFTTVPTNATKKLSQSAFLECSVGKVGGVKIHWLKNGKKLSSPLGSRYSLLHSEILHLKKLLVGDSGTYTCVATNLAGEIRASMYLRVVADRLKDCGMAKLKPRARIIGGSRAEEGTIPWQVLLWNTVRGRRKGIFCGGTLLNSRWIVTAAHCFPQYDMKNIEVRLGVHNWQTPKKYEQRYGIEQVRSNPRYNSSTYDSDIALVKLNGAVVMNQYIQPICLPSSTPDVASLKPGTHGKISGWGARKNTKNLKRVKTLHTAEVEIVNRTTCVNSHHPTYTVTLNMFCAGDASGSVDACQGDSGGPLTIKNTNSGRSELLGVISWGDGCAKKNKYGVYTKVQNYLKWIDANI